MSSVFVHESTTIRAGILSALIFQEKTQNEPPLTDRLQTAVAQVGPQAPNVHG